MLFSLNEFLMSVSFALDFVEMDILGARSNHGKRTAYIALRLSQQLGLGFEEIHDVVALSILHDNGISEKSLQDRMETENNSSVRVLENIKEHCIIGEKNVMAYPFLSDVKHVLKYHHERYDGKGYFNLKGNEIPLMSQIIHFGDVMERQLDINSEEKLAKQKIIEFMDKNKNKMFSEEMVEAFKKVIEESEFWLDIKDGSIGEILKIKVPQYKVDLSFEIIYQITQVLSKIIDSKSKYTQRHSQGLSEKAAIMSDYYGFSNDNKMKLRIAANLHDIGKLAVPNEILDKPGKLTIEEFDIIKKHPYYTRVALQQITGFEDITEWAANHHEKLNGQGYPFGLRAESLDFNSRLMACLDIYQALTEDRPYRKPLSHNQTMKILKDMKDNGFLDGNIINDINIAFSKL